MYIHVVYDNITVNDTVRVGTENIRRRSSIAVRVVWTALRCNAGRVPLALRVPLRLDRHLMRTVRIVRTVGRREAGRISGLGVRRQSTVVHTGGRRRMVLVTGRAVVILSVVVVVVVVAVVVVVHRGRRRGGRLCVRGQQRVVAVRVIRTQGRVQAGRVTGRTTAQHHYGLHGENNGLRT